MKAYGSHYLLDKSLRMTNSTLMLLLLCSLSKPLAYELCIALIVTPFIAKAPSSAHKSLQIAKNDKREREREKKNKWTNKNKREINKIKV